MDEKSMNDFKTPGREPPCTAGNFASAYDFRYVDGIDRTNCLTIDCKNVTFRLKELEINLSESKTNVYIDNIDTLTVNGVKFIKLESEGKHR